MPTLTYIPISEITIISAVTSLTLLVPTGYRDLVLITTTTNTSDAWLNVRFNGDSSSTYSSMRMVAYSGGTVADGSGSTTELTRVAHCGPYISTQRWQIFDASATDKYKSILIQDNIFGAESDTGAGFWNNLSSITSIYLFPASGSFAAGSSFNLYGIEA